ncbi:MAG: low molecular weight phosphatase family protein [Salinigranum sp.]
MPPTEPIGIAFVCVRNAGRSQMAAAFAERERDRRGLDGRVRIESSGTDPGARVHGVVVEAMAERGSDLSGRRPRELTREELAGFDYVITMGCSAGEVCPATWRGDARDWALSDPGERDLDDVREIRDEVERRVRALFDELFD